MDDLSFHDVARAVEEDLLAERDEQLRELARNNRLYISGTSVLTDEAWQITNCYTREIERRKALAAHYEGAAAPEAPVPVLRVVKLNTRYVSQARSPGIKRAQELVMNDGHSKRRAAEIAEAEELGKFETIRRGLNRDRWPDGPPD